MTDRDAPRTGSRSVHWRGHAARQRRRLAGWIAGERHHVGPGEVALTFDDGPDPALTPRLLDALRDAEAAATFFVVGERAVAHPDVVRRMVAEGHSVGHHTMGHGDLRRLAPRSVHAEVDGARRALEALLEQQPLPLFRPPKGRLGVLSALVVRAGGHAPWSWTIDSDDWRPGATEESVLRRCLEVNGGDVVLLHDTLAHSVEAAPLLVSRLRQRGLRPVAL